jgi:hypothetical protein
MENILVDPQFLWTQVFGECRTIPRLASDSAKEVQGAMEATEETGCWADWLNGVDGVKPNGGVDGRWLDAVLDDGMLLTEVVQGAREEVTEPISMALTLTITLEMSNPGPTDADLKKVFFAPNLKMARGGDQCRACQQQRLETCVIPEGGTNKCCAYCQLLGGSAKCSASHELSSSSDVGCG